MTSTFVVISREGRVLTMYANGGEREQRGAGD